VVQRIDNPTAPLAPSGATYSYCNPGAITIPYTGANPNPAGPYPFNLFVANLPGLINTVTVSLSNFSFNGPVHLLSLLTGPNGNNLDFFSNAGGTGNPTGINPKF
jgi:hypothetical protein